MFTRQLLFCLWMCSLSALCAQTTHHRINAGFVAGINTSQIDGDRAHGYNNNGPVLGGFVNLPLSKTVSIQPEMLYMRLGGSTGKKRGTGFMSNSNGAVDVEVHSLSLPFLLKFRMGDQADLFQYFDLFIGPALGVQLQGRDISARNVNPEIAALNRYDARVVLGGEISLGEVAELNLNFSYSVTPVLEAEIVQPGSLFRDSEPIGVAWRHNYLSLTLRINILRDR